MIRSARSSTRVNSPCAAAAFEDGEEQLDLVEPRGVGRGVVQKTCGCSSRNASTVRGAVGLEVVDDAVQVQPGGGLGDEIGEERDEVLRAGRVGHPPGDVAVVHVEGGEQHGGAVAAVLELAAHRDAGHRRLVGLTRLLACIPASRRPTTPPRSRAGSVQAAHVTGLRPEVGVVAGHPRLALPRLEIQRPTDPPRLRRRDRTPWSFIAAASASIVQRVAPSGGGSVTVLTNNNTSSWSYTGGRPGRSSSSSPATPNSP